MDDDALNLSTRKFLKTVGINSQREIERAVARAIENGDLTGDETVPAIMTLAIPTLGVEVTFDGEIKLK